MDNASRVELLAKIIDLEPVVVVIPVKDGDEGFNNEDQSYHDNKDFSDLDLEEILGDIDDEGMVEGEDAQPYSARNMGYGIVIRNNLGTFISSIDPDAAHVGEFPKYEEIVLTHLLEGELDAEELFVG
ncbi:hypothetical protein GOBAR_AA00827 [Gossypium barbadense]|uniref:Uncharacterized protein n=1 Tax=Gossypium barbadense TaxID=3634 RepID=A0A2P5YW05_GOSBA|nr:hypothetical protein GOBAR_AA00827 [Gossypium barbadense]